MKSILSNNEKAVFEVVFSKHDPEIKLLSHLLVGKLTDKSGKSVQDSPDLRFVSKLKSTGLKKISDSISNTANLLRLDVHNPPKNYSEKIKACIFGLNFILNAQIYVIFLLGEGPVAWYVHNSQNCEQCKPGGVCTTTLNQIIEERALELPEELLLAPIDVQAEWVFEKGIGLEPLEVQT